VRAAAIGDREVVIAGRWCRGVLVRITGKIDLGPGAMGVVGDARAVDGGRDGRAPLRARYRVRLLGTDLVEVAGEAEASDRKHGGGPHVKLLLHQPASDVPDPTWPKARAAPGKQDARARSMLLGR
jgi:hypothetical protein